MELVIKLLILALFIAFGIGAVKFENFAPFMPNGGIGVMQGAALIFFAYSGFARITLVIGLVTCVMLLFFLVQDAWIIGGIALLSGVIYYYTIKISIIIG